MRSRTVVMLGLLAVVLGARMGREAVVHAAPTSPHKPTKEPHDGAKMTPSSLTANSASWLDGKIAVALKKPKKDNGKKLDAAPTLVAKTKKKGFPKKADGYLFGAEVA
jgi:hypothetical protein